MKILLVENNRVCRYVTQIGLAQFADVDVATSARAALNTYDRRGPYDLLIIAVRLPDSSALELLEGIYERAGTARVIIYTDHFAEALHMKCEDFTRLHVVDVWCRPMAVRGLAERIASTLQHGAFAYCQPEGAAA